MKIRSVPSLRETHSVGVEWELREVVFENVDFKGSHALRRRHRRVLRVFSLISKHRNQGQGKEDRTNWLIQ